MASLFDTLQANAQRAGVTARTRRSQLWFQKNVKKLAIPDRKKLLKDPALDPGSEGIAGNMYMYFYDPKLKNELPYYDRFPLTIIVQPESNGFSGLNLHYLSPGVRARFLDELMATAPKNINDTTRLKLRYKLLAASKKYKEFKPCWKRYLGSNVRSRIVRVPMTEWEIAVFLPVQQFAKVKDVTVWRASRRSYGVSGGRTR